MTLGQPLRDPSYLRIQDVTHRFGSQFALESVSLELPRGQILALLGPSGSGKSTLLAAIAGLIQPTSGEVWLGGEALTHLPPERRDLGMMFQDYALWPHMTVMQNIAFPLRQRGIPAQQVRERVEQALAQVELTGFEDRYPAELSGGQQQRVALARAVVAEPRLLLLDEPFSALDPETRSAVRAEIRLLLRRLGVTTVLVTHDREEAFELSDQVAILLKGRIQQCAAPEEVYERPSHPAVATFLGLNLLRVKPGSTPRRVRIGDGERELEVFNPEEMPPVWIAIAPERVQILPYRGSLAPQQLLGWVRDACYSGGEYRLTVEVEGIPDQCLRARSSFKPQETHVVVELPIAALHGLGAGAHSPPLAGIRSG